MELSYTLFPLTLLMELASTGACNSSNSPVWMRCGQHELEFHHAGVILKLAVLYTVKFIGNISPSNIHLVKK